MYLRASHRVYSTLAVPSDGAPLIEPLSGAVWLSIGDSSGADFLRALGRRGAAFLGCGAAASEALGVTRREAGRFVAFGAFADRAGLAASAGALRAFAARADEAALRGAGSALPRADLAFAFSRVAFSLSLRAASFSRIAASAAFVTCDRLVSGAESKASKKALMTLLVPRGADVSRLCHIEFCPPTLVGITLNRRRDTSFRCPHDILACACFYAFHVCDQAWIANSCRPDIRVHIGCSYINGSLHDSR
jgi:hypothetical protein